MMSKYRIIGIDPGSQITGFCILEKPDKNSRNIKEMKIVDAGYCEPKAVSLATRKQVICIKVSCL